MKITNKQLQAIKNMNKYLGRRNTGLKDLDLTTADKMIKNLIKDVKEYEWKLEEADAPRYGGESTF